MSLKKNIYLYTYSYYKLNLFLKENVPINKDQQWLHKIFSSYGNVVYVSLPVFKTSRQNKGFAFVEYSAHIEALKAFEVNLNFLNYYNLHLISPPCFRRSRALG